MPIMVPLSIRKKAEDLLYQQAKEEFCDKQIAGWKWQFYLRKVDENQAFNDYTGATLEILKPHYKKDFLRAIQDSTGCSEVSSASSTTVCSLLKRSPG